MFSALDNYGESVLVGAVGVHKASPAISSDAGKGIGLSGVSSSTNFGAEFSRLKGWGVGHARVILSLYTNADGTLSTADTTDITEMLDSAESYGVKVIIVMSNTKTASGLTTAENEAQWIKFLADCDPHPAILAYEVMNEPLGSDQIADEATYQTHQEAMITLIRASNSDVNIIVSTGGSRAQWLDTGVISANNLNTLLAIDNLWYSGHFYEPFVYTHNGVGAQEDVYHLYPETDEVTTMYDNLTESNRIWDGKEAIRDHMAIVREFEITKSATIYAGEFSVIPDNSNSPNDVLFLTHLIELFDQYDWAWSYWAQAVTELEGAGQGIWDPEGDRLTMLQEKWAN